MCGRYRLSRRKEFLAEHFSADFADLDWEPRYNIAPTQPVPVLRQDDPTLSLKVSLMRWGLIPSWAADPGIGARTINARAETAVSKPSFREPLRRQRCLIPADGFYEWQRMGKSKQPFCFEAGDGSVFAFAGLWDRWSGPNGQVVETCTILTTTPNELMANIHDRMPVILPVEQYQRWLDPRMQDSEGALRMLKQYESQRMKRYPVSTRINNVANDDAECSRLLDVAQTPLFS